MKTKAVKTNRQLLGAEYSPRITNASSFKNLQKYNTDLKKAKTLFLSLVAFMSTSLYLVFETNIINF